MTNYSYFWFDYGDNHGEFIYKGLYMYIYIYYIEILSCNSDGQMRLYAAV